MLDVDTPVVVRTYKAPAPANLDITNALTPTQGLVGATLKGKQLPADLVPSPFNAIAFTIELKLKSLAATGG